VSAIDQLLDHSEAYARRFAAGDLPAEPAKRVAVVVCMDARIETGALLGLAEGDAHVIRNAGGIVTDDVLRSLAISQRMLGTREVMVVQHTGCGMATFEGEAFRKELERETGVRPPFDIGTFDDVERSVRDSIARIAASPFLLHDAVRGFVYEVETGRLREVAPEGGAPA